MQNKEKNSFIRLYIKYIVLRPQIAIFPVKISILSFGKIGVKSQYIEEHRFSLSYSPLQSEY